MFKDKNAVIIFCFVFLALLLEHVSRHDILRHITDKFACMSSHRRQHNNTLTKRSTRPKPAGSKWYIYFFSMPKQIITVPAAPPTNYYAAGILIGAIIIAIAAKNQQGRTITVVAQVLLPLLLFLLRASIVPPRRSRKEIAVIVFPLGLQQVTRDEHGRYLSVPRFWPATDILDCIVVERILVHTVRSVVCLRIRNQTETETALVEAFPGATPNSYVKCLELRAQILGALGRRTNFIWHIYKVIRKD